MILYYCLLLILLLVEDLPPYLCDDADLSREFINDGHYIIYGYG